MKWCSLTSWATDSSWVWNVTAGHQHPATELQNSLVPPEEGCWKCGRSTQAALAMGLGHEQHSGDQLVYKTVSLFQQALRMRTAGCDQIPPAYQCILWMRHKNQEANEIVHKPKSAHAWGGEVAGWGSNRKHQRSLATKNLQSDHMDIILGSY